MIKGEERGRGKHEFTFRGAACQVNAVRRALISDLKMIAPLYLEIHENTTSHTDEYLSQRIGLIPFSQNHDHSTILADTLKARIDVSGRNVYTHDIVSDNGAPVPIESDICIANLRSGQSIKLDIHFTVGTCKQHARFMRTASVGMRPAQNPGEHIISFDTLMEGDDATKCIEEALKSLRTRLEHAKTVILTNHESEECSSS